MALLEAIEFPTFVPKIACGDFAAAYEKRHADDFPDRKEEKLQTERLNCAHTIVLSKLTDVAATRKLSLINCSESLSDELAA